MNKRDSSIFKIIIWSVIAFILMSVLISGIHYKSFPFSFSINTGNHNYFNSSSYLSGNNEVNVDGISDIVIDWIDGSVNVEGYDGDTIKFYEECGRELDEKDILHYYSNGNKLTIQYSSSKKIPISFGGLNNNKSLTVQIPMSMAEQFNDLTIEAVSSDINVKNISPQYLEIENLSGKISLDSIKVCKIDVDSASGDVNSNNITIEKNSNINTISGNVNLNGNISAVDFDSTSGDLKLSSSTCPEKVETDTTSGNVTLNIPDNDGFTYSCDRVSGNLKCDFSTSGKNSEGIYGDGSSEFSFDTISGDVNICKN